MTTVGVTVVFSDWQVNLSFLQTGQQSPSLSLRLPLFSRLQQTHSCASTVTTDENVPQLSACVIAVLFG